MNSPRASFPPVIARPPELELDRTLARGARVAVMMIGLAAVTFMLHAGGPLLVPLTLALVVGLVLGPVVTRLERRGVPSTVAAALVVVLFLLAVLTFITAILAPLAVWASRLPQMWSEVQFKLSGLREPLNMLRGAREQIREITGDSDLTVSVDGASPIESVATMAPTAVAQILLFLASLFLFLATRNEMRSAILKRFADRRTRTRIAHVFRDVENMVSRYLISITLINTGLGVAVGLAMWLMGLPTPAVWGAVAGLLNFILFIGPAITAAILFTVSLAVFDTLSASFLPPLVFLSINLIEAQFVTPLVVGKRMSLNSFVVFVAIAFWLWLWGPVGGIVAIPILLMIVAIMSNMAPDKFKEKDGR